jgi:murein DD-endopeptidase MepM/ murein hydrolase activator NlpD
MKPVVEADGGGVTHDFFRLCLAFFSATRAAPRHRGGPGMSGVLPQTGWTLQSLALQIRDHWSAAQSTLRTKIDAWFPERQLLIRGPGNFTSIHLSQKRQIGTAALGAAVIVWATIATLGFGISLGRQAADAIATRHLVQAVAQSQAELVRMRAETAQLARSRTDAIAAAEAARDAAIAKADAVAGAYDAKLNQLTRKTQGAIGQVETIIRSTGLNPKSLAASPPDSSILDAGHRAALLLQDLAELKSLAAFLAQMPLAAPVSSISVSSPFGFRPNPWTGAREFHVGVDLRGPIGAPVYATAPGVVRFAGVQTGYGNIVIIDHGFGLSTRYSHLSKILVRVGTDVDLHQVIGLLGSTGWSTGPHLLYETRVDGQPHDPLNFIKVSRHGVQK